MTRRIISLAIAMLLVLGMPLQALADTWDAEDFAKVKEVFETDTDAEVVVNLTQDIVWEEQVTANVGQNYTINGNGNDVTGMVNIAGSGSVVVDADVVETDYIDSSVSISNGADVTINGNVTAWSVSANTGSTLKIKGNVDASSGVTASESSITIAGSINATNGDAVKAANGTVTVDGNVSSRGGHGVNAYYNSSIAIGGNITGGAADLGNGFEIQDSILADNSTVTVGGDVDKKLTATNSTVTVDGDVINGIINATNSTVTVEGSVTGGYDLAPYGGEINADGSTVSIDGSVTGYGVTAQNNSNVDISGYIEAGQVGIDATQSIVTVGGDVTSKDNAGVRVSDSTIEIGGSVTGGIDAMGNAQPGLDAIFSDVTIYGDVSASDLSGNSFSSVFCGSALIAGDSDVYVGGNVNGSDITVDVKNPTNGRPNIGGDAISTQGTSNVTVIGNVTGGNATGEGSIGGSAIYVFEMLPDLPYTGTVKIAGTVTAGTGEARNGLVGDYEVLVLPKPVLAPVAPVVDNEEEPVISISVGSSEEEIPLTITISDAEDEIIIKEMKAEEVETLIETLKKSVNEGTAENVKIDVSAHTKITSVRIPVETLKSIIETFGKLEIIFKGGSIIIDAEMLEELVDELGFFTISLE